MKKTIILKQQLPSPLTFKGGQAGASVPATSAAAGDTYVITSAGTSQTKTWIVGQLAVYNGVSGSWTQVPLALMVQVAMPTATTDSGAAGQFSVDATKMAMYSAGTGWLFFDGYQV